MTAVFMLNDLLMLNNVDLQRHARSVMRGKQIKAIVVIINVAGGIKKTDVATPNKLGRHWSLLYIDAVENKWFYCDTLAWPPPTNINTTVNAILNVLAMEFPVFRRPAQGRFIAHKPEGNQRGSHQCTNGCFKNVPFFGAALCFFYLYHLVMIAQTPPPPPSHTTHHHVTSLSLCRLEPFLYIDPSAV